MAGRKPKTAAQKTLEGNPGRRPIKPHLMAELEVPAAPAHMEGLAKATFEETALRLYRLGVMTALDVFLLESYAENYAMMVETQAYIREHGMTYEAMTKSGVSIRQRPELAILNQCRAMHRQYSGELGLTPASRTKLPDASQGDLFKERQNPFSEFAPASGRVN